MSESGPPPVPGGRSPEERERARLEREARRSGKGSEPKAERSSRRRRQRAPEDVVEPQAAAPPPTPGEPGPAPRARQRAPSRETVDRLLARRRERAAGGSTKSAPRRRAAGRAALIVLGLFGLIALWFVFALFQPFKGDGDGRVRVVIPTGAGVGQIGDLLESRGVVSSSFFFELRTTLGGRRGDLRPGSYTLAKDMAYGTAIEALAGGPAPDLVNLTLPEGRSRRELAPTVRQAGIDGSYTRATTRSRLLDPRDYGTRRARNLEGFLLPATYELRRGSTVGGLVRKQLQTFKRQFRTVDLRGAKRKNLSEYDVLTIASMVEREAQVPRERRIVASVIYNRLRAGMPLGIDATIRFATGNWTRPLRQSELQSASPYNTRTRTGLPPGPIGSPGLASIRAAANPARTGFLFYVVKPGSCGEHAFSETDAEFQCDSARYNAERAKRGGRSPTDCPS